MCSLRALGGAVGVEAERTFYCSRNSHVAVVAAVVVVAVVVAAVVAAVVAVVVAAAAAAGCCSYAGGVVTLVTFVIVKFTLYNVGSVHQKLAPLVWKEKSFAPPYIPGFMVWDLICE